MKNHFFTYIIKSFNAIPSLTKNLAQYLQAETITENKQGKIVKDIEFLVDFIQSNQVQVSQNNYFFGLKYLEEINQNLSYPIETNLKRPVQKSYLYIDGLYLILRNSGLGQIIKKGKSNCLKINEDILSQWQQLNLTEKYFSLLECWFWWSNTSLLGKDYCPFSCLESCVKFWQNLPPKGIKVPEGETHKNLIYYLDDYNIALLHLFGLIDLTLAKPLPNKGWIMNTIKPTKWGQAIISLMTDIAKEIQHPENPVETEEKIIDFQIKFNFTQPQLSLYFPEWHNTLILCDYEFKPALYIMTIYLDKVFRKIAIPNTIDLDKVVDIIMDFFDFDPLHLHKFMYQDPTGNICYFYHPETDLFYERDECDYSNKYCLGDIPLKIGESLTLIFDFREEWEFTLILEQIELLSSENQEPQLLKSKGKAPDNSQDDFILIYF
jgi:hypothetical protein